ncbi:MAG: hypothetical protein C4527_10555 [Candidatus Omnitrophota bacterium]|nr:MAG: hypothetical protein C4527_10555 [Candidatus Omnitrophota bacterium]
MNMSILISLLLLANVVGEKENQFIENMMRYSKQLMPIVYQIETSFEYMPKFNNKKEALEYVTRNLSNDKMRSKMDDEKYKKIVENHVNFYTTKGVGGMKYTIKCLDLDTHTIFCYDKNLKQSVEVLLYHDGITANYNLRSNHITIYSNPTQTRWTSCLFEHERIYNLLSTATIELTNEKDFLKLLVVPSKYEQFTLYFNEDRPFFPSKFIHEAVNFRSEYEYPPFDKEQNLPIPTIFFYKQFRIHPVSQKEYLEMKTKYDVTDFKIVPELIQQDIDIEIPPGTSVSDHIYNSHIKISSEPNRPSTLFGIMAEVISEKK